MKTLFFFFLIAITAFLFFLSLYLGYEWIKAMHYNYNEMDAYFDGDTVHHSQDQIGYGFLTVFFLSLSLVMAFLTFKYFKKTSFNAAINAKEALAKD